jgi:hypothetical protein
MHDQLKALDAVARHIGFDKTKVEVSGPDGQPIKTESSVAIYELPNNGRG